MPDVILPIASGSIRLRRAVAADLPAILELLADDAISASRGDLARPEDFAAYERAFAAIDRDPAQRLLVATAHTGADASADSSSSSSSREIVATMQLTVIPGLARVGASRLQIEAVRVRSDRRGLGIGGAMITWAVEDAGRTGAALVQLTSDAARVDAHRFYERLGFAPSHVGFKKPVAAQTPTKAQAQAQAQQEPTPATLHLNEEAAAFVTDRHLATLSTHDRSGSIHSVPVGFTVADSLVRIISSDGTQKVRNIERDARATVSQYEGARWMTFIGRATILRGADDVDHAVELYAARYRRPQPNPKRIVIAITVDQVLGSSTLRGQ